MNKKLVSELKKLAKKYNMEISFQCSLCGHEKENLGWKKCGLSWFLTLTEKEIEG